MKDFVSIHAPRVGARPAELTAWMGYASFNPRAPRGGATPSARD